MCKNTILFSALIYLFLQASPHLDLALHHLSCSSSMILCYQTHLQFLLIRNQLKKAMSLFSMPSFLSFWFLAAVCPCTFDYVITLLKRLQQLPIQSKSQKLVMSCTNFYVLTFFSPVSSLFMELDPTSFCPCCSLCL